MNAESIKAIVALVVTAAVNVANVCGFALDYGMLYNTVLSIASVVCVGYVWWKNQNVTAAAQQAQEYLKELKSKAE
jgi:hypothetical protein